MTGLADGLVASLAARGVRRAYTVPGESFLPLLDALDRHPDLRLVSTRHESGASFMAEADAKLSGRPAVVLATRGVGAANLAIGVHTAYQDSTPMLVILGQVETTRLGREAFQEVDLPRFYGQITKWSATATSADRLPELIDRALHEATTGRPGPAMLAVPADLLEQELTAPDGWRPGIAATATATIDQASATTIAAQLAGARAPVVIAGGGAQHARAELTALADRFNAGVYASFRRQDVFANDHPHYCGHLTLGTPPETLRALEQADVVLVVGARLSEVTTQGYRLPSPRQRVLQIDIDPRSVGSVLPVAIGAVADSRAALAAILAHAPAQLPARSWAEAHQAYLAASTPPDHQDPPPHQDRPLHPGAVVATIASVFPPSTIVVNDAGNFSVFAHRYWRFTQPRTQVGPTSGAMGYAIPGAVGATFAATDREVLALCGDGGFLMTGQELETAVRYERPFTAVVFRNGLYGTIALHQARALGRTSGVDIAAVDIAALARAYGALGWSASTVDELAEALVAARASGRPALVDVVVDPDVLTPAERLSEVLARHRVAPDH